ncbi:MAG: MMPL family transporter [Pseudomonadota bacterium]|nr:MMPL family transporter [Pseudomonadota bacterium]
MAHNKTKLLVGWVLVSGLVLSGMPYLEFSLLQGDLILLSTSLLVMSVVVGYLLESPKVALLQLVLSIYIVLMTFGCLGWLGYELTQESLLGLVVLITLMSSNLVHILSTLLREMARGLFQYDAVAEALKLNTSPILLSNLTTALGFVLAAWVDSAYSPLAWLVIVGVFFSFLITVSWLPMVLLNWLLEFRVGNTVDRKGLTFVANWLLKNPLYRWLIIGLGLLLAGVLIFANFELLTEFEQLFWLVGIFGILFLLFWQSLSMALMNLMINFLALLTAISLFVLLTGETQWALLAWMVPLGIIVDDGIHFFSRYARAKYTVFSDPKSAVIFAMASVGRPIWITSWVLFTGLAVLLVSDNRMVFEASLLTMLALVVATLFILMVLPALLMSSKPK